jgi:hypothetical protein
MWEEGTGSAFDQVAPAERASRPLQPAPVKASGRAAPAKERRRRRVGETVPRNHSQAARESDWADRVRNRDPVDLRQNARSHRDDAVRSGPASSSSKPS